jgi:hypothetical protein
MGDAMPVTKCSIKSLCRVALFLATSLVAGAAQAFSAYGLDAAGDTAPMNQQQQAQQQQYQLKQQLQLQQVQQHQQSVDSTQSSVEEGRESACEQLKTDADLDPIRGKIAIANEKITPEMAGNLKTPSNIEGASLKIYAQTDARCIFQDVVSAFPGKYSTQSEKDSLYSGLLNEEYQYIEPLIQGKISYGRYNEEMIKIGVAMQSALSPKTQNSNASTVIQAPLKAAAITLNCVLSNQYISGQVALRINYAKKTVNGLNAKFSDDYITFHKSASDGTIIQYSIDRLSGYLSAMWRYQGMSFNAGGLCNKAKRQF